MKLFIEKFKEQRLSTHEGRPGTITAQLEEGLYREIDRSIKYRFTNSALAMLLHLYHSRLRVSMPPSAPPTWIEFYSPFTLDAYRTDLDLPTVQCLYFSKHIPESIYPNFKTAPQQAYIKTTRDNYDLEMLAPTISQKFPLRYTAHSHQWSFSIPHKCPVNECIGRQLDLLPQSVEGYLHEPCLYCLSAKGKFSRLFAFALAMVRGDFAEEPNRPFPIETERVIHKGAGKGGKPQTQVFYHHYHLVNFDASLKAGPFLSEEKSCERQPLSWLDLASRVDPNSVIYVLHSIAQRPRTFWHERYVNMQGQTILVKPHEKQIPMRVGTMKVVRASAFEPR